MHPRRADSPAGQLCISNTHSRGGERTTLSTPLCRTTALLDAMQNPCPGSSPHHLEGWCTPKSVGPAHLPSMSCRRASGLPLQRGSRALRRSRSWWWHHHSGCSKPCPAGHSLRGWRCRPRDHCRRRSSSHSGVEWAAAGWGIGGEGAWTISHAPPTATGHGMPLSPPCHLKPTSQMSGGGIASW